MRFITNISANRSFVLTTSDGQHSRLRRLRNGLPQGSCLSPLLFNIYISDLSKSKSLQYGYPDDLALFYSHQRWGTIEDTLTADVEHVAEHFKLWRLKISAAKTTVTPFHLNNREYGHQLSVFLDGNLLPLKSCPTYLGVKLDRNLTYKYHTEALHTKLTARNNLLRCLAGSTWGASTSTLRTSALAIVYSTAVYIWCRSVRVRKIDAVLNHTMRITTGCLRPTPADFLQLSGIVPASLRRKHLVHRLTQQAASYDGHPLNKLVMEVQSLRPKRLKSRHPFSRHTAELLRSSSDLSKTWCSSWEKTTKPEQLTVSPSTKSPPGAELTRKHWVKFNRLRTGVSRFNSNMYTWSLADLPYCTCELEPQPAQHILHHCPIYRPREDVNLTELDDNTIQWLLRLDITT